MSNNQDIHNVVKNALQIHNVGPHIIDQVPTLVKRAIIKLQKKEILPPRVIEFESGNKKESKYDSNGELFFNYYSLPDDFRKHDEFYVHDGNDNPNNRTPYLWVPHENYLNNRDLNDKRTDKRKWFTITDINEEDGRNRKILIANPFPKDDVFVRLKYFPDGTDTDYDYITSDKWESVITQVESLLKLTSRREADEQAQQENTDWRNQKGKNTVNGTVTRTSPSYPFTGATGEDVRSRNYRGGRRRGRK